MYICKGCHQISDCYYVQSYVSLHCLWQQARWVYVWSIAEKLPMYNFYAQTALRIRQLYL